MILSFGCSSIVAPAGLPPALICDPCASNRSWTHGEQIDFAASVNHYSILLSKDVTAYVIARTLHAPKDKPRTPASVSAVPAVSSQSSRDTTDTVPSRPSSLSRGTSALSVHGRPPAHGEPAWFTFPAADEKLSGVGVFSPPITRSPSPSNDRPSMKSSLFMTRATPNAAASDIAPPPGWEPVNMEDVRNQEGHTAS